MGMKQPKYLRQLSKKKAISEVFVHLILLLIAVFSGFIVRFMAGSLIQDYILNSLNTRLMIHGITTAYNSMYSLPTGIIDYTATFPEDCRMECVDCNLSVRLLPPSVETVCDCNDNQESLNWLLPNVEDTELLICDDYIVKSVEPVMLFKGDSPISSALKINLQIYPKSPLFLRFNDYLSEHTELDAISQSLQTFFPGLKLFTRDISVFSEFPLNLNDYSMVRRLATTSSLIDFAKVIKQSTEKTVDLKRVTYNTYDSVSETRNVIGLKGVIETVLMHTFNRTIEGSADNYILKSGIDSAKGVLCPQMCNEGVCTYECPIGTSFSTGSNYPIIIPPGVKLVREDDKKICSYECYTMNSLDNECESDWRLTDCFDFRDVEKLNCPNCSAGDFNYNVLSLCSGNECAGASDPDYNEFNFYDILKGGQVFTGDNEMTLLTSDLITYTELSLSNLDPKTYCPSSDCPASGCTCYARTSTPTEWIAGKDCKLELTYDSNQPGGFIIRVSDNSRPEYECDNCLVGVCTCDDYSVVEKFKGCDRAGIYPFNYDGGYLELSDIDSVTHLSAILAGEVEPVTMTYTVTPFGTYGGAGEFKSILTPTSELETASAVGIASPEALNDKEFILDIKVKALPSPELIIELTEAV